MPNIEHMQYCTDEGKGTVLSANSERDFIMYNPVLKPV